MSHQTGIRPNEKLKKFFAKCHSGKIRLFKVTIENEELSLSAQIDSKGTWEDDFEKNIKKLVQEDQPCYIMIAYSFSVFIYSMPGYSCPIKERMLYSSSKGPLIETVESILGAKIDKKMEVDSGKEVTEECLIDALHPAPLDAASGVAAKKFDKPKGPARAAAFLQQGMQRFLGFPAERTSHTTFGRISKLAMPLFLLGSRGCPGRALPPSRNGLDTFVVSDELLNATGAGQPRSKIESCGLSRRWAGFSRGDCVTAGSSRRIRFSNVCLIRT
ncbi:unnamed protein product [Nesidiocoris tenuis]|uniref:ADF-H domain-containing protein n=1 Tax=Nesidiocoris tenuis TaxID=355587 RepID=A0A6H5GXA8_9HEMI|nr:unnamed protein product [Nesidiocoris tenuis]